MAHPTAGQTPARKVTFTPFVLTTSRLLLVPTPLAVDSQPYRDMYAGLLATPEFTKMAFGADFPVQAWPAEYCRKRIADEVERAWKIRGMGNMGVALLPESLRGLRAEGGQSCRVVTGSELELVMAGWDSIGWIGYAGVRDATTTSIPRPPEWNAERAAAEPAEWPPWQEMVEVKYGFAPVAWGKGYGTEAARAVMDWSVTERGTRRFISATEANNTGSIGILTKLGFVKNDVNYWGYEGAANWRTDVVGTS